MEDNDRKRSCLARAEARRNQVLKAAGDCFRQHGFHAASMSQISKSARMSCGHIYNYFECKEEIINAIVQLDIAETLQMIDDLESSGDALEAVASQVGLGVDRTMDRENSALMLEVLAEATRNHKVMQMVRQAHQAIKARMKKLLLDSKKGGQFLTDHDLDARVEILSAMFNGLMICVLVNPELDRDAVTRLLRQAVGHVLDPPPTGTESDEPS